MEGKMDNIYIEMCEKAFGDIGYISPTKGLPNLMIPVPGSIYKHERLVTYGGKEYLVETIYDGKKYLLEGTYASRFEDINAGSSVSSPIGQVYRQDQLWDVLSATHMLSAKISMFHDFYEPEFRCPGENNSLETSPCKKCVKLGVYRRKTFATMEQLILGFVMDELYKKRWDNTRNDWVKDKRYEQKENSTRSM